jgi:hypothetical protein
VRASISSGDSCACSGLNVLGRAEQVADARVGVRVIGRCGRRLGDSEVDDLRNRAPVDLRDQDVRRLEVAVDHAAQVRVLHARADLAEQREACRDVEPPFVAVACQGDAGHVLHREVRPAFRRRTRVEDPRDVRMSHQRQRLPLDLEACDDLARPEAELDHLQRDPPPDRRGLFGQEHLADRPLADALEDPVRLDGSRLQGTGSGSEDGSESCAASSRRTRAAAAGSGCAASSASRAGPSGAARQASNNS